MEQNMPYLMWMKSKHFQSPSWEEQAFAEDSSGPFVWPPRSYTCTFCNREFRSAQALGGHMNVHRRDRAKLKQSLCDEHECRVSNPSSPSPKNSASSDLDVREHKERKRVFVSASSDSPDEDDDDGRSFVETRLCVGMKSYGCKRLRSGGVGAAALYRKRPCSSSSDDEVDLELRLGDSPAVK